MIYLIIKIIINLKKIFIVYKNLLFILKFIQFQNKLTKI